MQNQLHSLKEPLSPSRCQIWLARLIALLTLFYSCNASHSSWAQAPKSSNLAAGDETRTLQVGQLTRSYVIHRPANLKAETLKAGNGTGRTTNMLTWNSGNCCAYAMRKNIDDVGFTRKLIETLVATNNVDPKRVFVTGISNGGMMSL